MATKNYTGNHDLSGATVTLADKAIAIAKLADGTDGELITWDAAGVISTVPTGTSTHVLTSNGAGAAPTFQAVGAGQATYDAIVAASGGDYTTLGAAITGGATNIFIKDGTYTETGNIVCPSNCQITGESFRGTKVVMTGYTLTFGAQNRIQNFWITSGHDSDTCIIGGGWVFLRDMFFENTLGGGSFTTQRGMVTDNNVAQIRFYMENCYFDLTPFSNVEYPNLSGVWIQNAGSNYHYYDNIQLGGALTRNLKAFDHAGNAALISNMNFLNVGKTGVGSMFIRGDNCTLTNINITNGDMRIELNGDQNTLTNVTADDANADVYIDGEGNCVSNAALAGQIITSANAHHTKISNSTPAGGVSISGDYNSIVGSTVGALAGGGAATITVASGAQSTTISACHVDADISDSGTDTSTDYVIY